MLLIACMMDCENAHRVLLCCTAAAVELVNSCMAGSCELQMASLVYAGSGIESRLTCGELCGELW